MDTDSMTRRSFLAAATVLPLPKLLQREAGCEVFTLPVHAWRAVASAALTARRIPVIGQDVSAGSAGMVASLISDYPSEFAYYRDLYFGIHEPTPALDAGRLWFSDPRRLQDLCVFLRRDGSVVEESDMWTILSRRK